MTVAGQPTVNYTYDNANLLTQITQASSTVAIAYNAAGRRTSLTLPNGILTEYGYDLASQLTSLTYKRGGSVIGDLTYNYDNAGRRTRMGGSFARSISPLALSSATYNAANQQLSFGGQTLSYDLNGNLLSDGTSSYTWDARNHLASISGPGVSASFQYHAAGRRISKTINSTTASSLYDGANIVQEQSVQLGNANIVSGGIDEIFTRSDSTGAFSPLRDGLGSSLALTDATGTVQTDYTYGAFGQTATSGAGSNNSSQYTGRENDGSGLYYYRARYYSPLLQRFISQDPIGFRSGDTNLYAYVKNDPLNSFDPLGLQDQEPRDGGRRPVPPPELDQTEIITGESINRAVELAGESSGTALGQMGGSALGLAGGIAGAAEPIYYYSEKSNEKNNEIADICCFLKSCDCKDPNDEHQRNPNNPLNDPNNAQQGDPNNPLAPRRKN